MLPSLIGIIASSGGAAAVGDFESISTVTVGAGGASTITFSSIPSTYKHLQIRWFANLQGDVNIRFNSDTGTNYAYHILYGAGSTPAGLGNGGFTYGYLAYGGFGGASAFTAGITDVLDYTSTNKNKTVRTLTGNDGNTTGGGVMLNSSLWYATPATVNSITLYSKDSVNFAQYSQFALYGVK